MAMQPTSIMENPVKLAHKSKKPKGMSSFAFLFSIIIYISIFYTFSLSLSTLIKNTKFWFVISNTLILIIAADYSSSKDQKCDLYEEYSLQSQARRRSSLAVSGSSFVSQYPEIVKKSSPKEKEINWKEKKKEEIIIADEKNKEIPERILEVVKFEPKFDNFQPNIQQEQELELEHPNLKVDKKSCNDHHHDQIIKKKAEPKSIRRSKSDKVKRVTFHDKKNNLQRTKTAKHEPSSKETENNIPVDEESEFSNMSNEELNRRVEEFIQKFNREIRLQNRQLLEFE